MIYLFLGHEIESKNTELARLLDRYIPAPIRHFNYEILYADELKLQVLQERLKSLPVRNPRRLVLIKSAHKLKKDVQEYVVSYLKNPYKHVIVVLDAEPRGRHDTFLRAVAAQAQVVRSHERPRLDAFMLSRQIESRRCAEALRVLKELLDAGEKPERILGGLRYAWERSPGSKSGYNVRSLRGEGKAMRLLLECDQAIKTGRLKPQLALERLVITLSARA